MVTGKRIVGSGLLSCFAIAERSESFIRVECTTVIQAATYQQRHYSSWSIPLQKGL